MPNKDPTFKQWLLALLSDYKSYRIGAIWVVAMIAYAVGLVPESYGPGRGQITVIVVFVILAWLSYKWQTRGDWDKDGFADEMINGRFRANLDPSRREHSHAWKEDSEEDVACSKDKNNG